MHRPPSWHEPLPAELDRTDEEPAQGPPKREARGLLLEITLPLLAVVVIVVLATVL